MTMSANSVSSNYLINSLVLPVTQAQAQLTKAMTEESTGQYADLGLQLGDQSGYELSLKEQVQLLQALTAGNSVVSTNLSTAQNALSSIASSAQSTMSDLIAWTPDANSGATLQTMGQSALQGLIASTNTTSGDQYVVEIVDLLLQDGELRTRRIVRIRHRALRRAELRLRVGERGLPLRNERLGGRGDRLLRGGAQLRAAEFGQHRIGLGEILERWLIGVGRGRDDLPRSDLGCRVRARSGRPIGRPVRPGK
jgi:Bacterial flagellin N-terminal helical region